MVEYRHRLPRDLGAAGLPVVVFLGGHPKQAVGAGGCPTWGGLAACVSVQNIMSRSIGQYWVGFGGGGFGDGAL